MAMKTIISTVTGVLTEVRLGLEGRGINLASNGDEVFRSKDTIDVEGKLGIALFVRGIRGTAWSIKLACADAPDKPFFEDNGVTNEKGMAVMLNAVDCPC